MCLSNELSCEAGNFSCCQNLYRFFQSKILRLHFPPVEPWVVWSVLLRSCSSRLIHTQMWDCSVYQQLPCLESSPTQLLVSAPPTSLDKCFSLTPWLLDFYIIQFSGSSDYFLFLNLLSFLLCKEAKCIYLCVHLG